MVMAVEISDRLARANDRMRESSYPLSDEPVPFFCECDDPHCYRPVWLTADEFDRGRALAEPVLAEHARTGLTAA